MSISIKSIEKVFSEAGIVEITIIPWELDEGELGINIKWAGGNQTAIPVKTIGDIAARLKNNTPKPLNAKK